jgi:uncharacterized protein (TIGR02270 family)
VLAQHLEGAAGLRAVRSVLVRAAHVGLLHLGRADDRLAACLDGLAAAGDEGTAMSRAALDGAGVGAVFVVAVLAIGRRDGAELARLLALAEAEPQAARALISAFGWVSGSSLRGMTAALLASALPAWRLLGIAACAQHRVDPGKAALGAAIEQPHPVLRARALRAIGELGCADLLPLCMAHLHDEDPACALSAAVSGLRLGNRGACAEALAACAMQPRPAANQALALALCSAGPDGARRTVAQLAAAQAPLRSLIRAAGWAGDPQVLPWLLKHMAQDRHARLAGEVFSLVTGIDITASDLDRKPPENFESGPSDDPNDDNVAMDDDDGLPWPDTAKIQAWWNANKHRFQPGVRYFMGEPPSVPHCIRVLREGYQRQRIAAAEYLCLLQPGTKLFPTSAPAWRQQRWLDKMG